MTTICLSSSGIDHQAWEIDGTRRSAQVQMTSVGNYISPSQRQNMRQDALLLTYGRYAYAIALFFEYYFFIFIFTNEHENEWTMHPLAKHLI